MKSYMTNKSLAFLTPVMGRDVVVSRNFKKDKPKNLKNMSVVIINENIYLNFLTQSFLKLDRYSSILIYR